MREEIRIMKRLTCVLMAVTTAIMGAAIPASAQNKKPNIVVIMSDDVGIWNISAYHRGMMGGSTPNIDRIAKGVQDKDPTIAELLKTQG